MHVEPGYKIQDTAGNLYEVLSFGKTDQFLYHSQYGGMKVELKCIAGPHTGRTSLVAYKKIIEMARCLRCWVVVDDS